MAKGGKTSIGNIFVWILLALLIIGLAGFGATSFGSNTPAVATVGDRDVEMNRYYRAAQGTLSNLQAQGVDITASSPQGQQVLEQLRGNLLREAAVENETMQLGISLGDETIARRVQQIDAFTGMDGQFDRAAYEAALRRVGMNPTDFENDLRIETTRDLLRTTVTAGAELPDRYTDTLLAYFGERRDIRLVRYTPDALDSPVPPATQAQARAHYDANPADFTLPARKSLTYAWLTPDMLLDSVEISDSDLRGLYDERAADFSQPERRMIERLVFPDDAAAQAARNRIDAGEVDFDTLVTERGLTLDDVDMGAVVAADLGGAGDAVFALEAPGVAGPSATDLGPALFRVYAILDPVEVAFEDAREMLRTELALDRARRVIDGQVADLEDLLASGATLEELARETDMQLGTVDWWPGVTDGIAGYENFRRAAQQVQMDDFPATAALEDGGIFALRLDTQLEPELQDFDAVRDAAGAGWQAAEEVRRLRDLAETAAAQLAVGGTLEATGRPVEPYPGLTRDGGVPGAGRALVEGVFEMREGAAQTFDGPGGSFLVVLDAIVEADDSDPEISQIRQFISQQVNQSLATDIDTLFARALTLSAGITLNTAAINAVHAELP